MARNKKKLNQKQHQTLLKLFLKTAGITLVTVGVLGGALAGGYYAFLYDGKATSAQSTPVEEKEVVEEKEEKRREINKTVAVFGVDKDGIRTDVNFVVNVNSETHKIKVLSIPRDTKVNWSEEQQDRLIDLKGYSRSVSKLNEMTAYAGIENIRDFTIDEIENILGITVDNYVLVNLSTFRDIVDAIGGVEVDVPEFKGRGLHYDDYEQDLHIHLDPGVQTLNGEQAEGFVRFRKDNYGNSYAEGDKGRIETQQIFLEAFADKVMSSSVISNLYNIISTVFTNVSTDIKLTEIPTYLSYLEDFSADNIEFYIADGVGGMENGISYYFLDYDLLDATIQEVFYDTVALGQEETSVDTEEVIEDKTVNIEIYNATGVNGIAGGLKDKLEKLGYTVPKIANYDEELAETLIYAKDQTKAKQFKQYLTDTAIIIEDKSISADIQIAVGMDYINK